MSVLPAMANTAAVLNPKLEINEAEITGYLDKLKGESEEQMDVPAFLRHAQLSQRHIPSPVPAFAPAPQKQQQQAQKLPSSNSWNR